MRTAGTSEEPSRPKIAICIPHQETVYMQVAAGTLMPLAVAEKWCDFLYFFELGYSIGLQRDNLVKSALEQKADYIWFIDSDMLFRDNPRVALKALFDMQIPIAAGLAREKLSNIYPFAAFTRNATGAYEYVQKIEGLTPFKVDGVGMYCCLIKREVFEKLKEPWFVYSNELAEDLYFCKKATEAGYEITIDPTVQLGHMGVFTLHPNGNVYGKLQRVD